MTTPLTKHDHMMFDWAKRRQPVIVTRDERTTLVTLVAWRPVRHNSRRNIARVMYPSGKIASVPIANVAVPEEK